MPLLTTIAIATALIAMVNGKKTGKKKTGKKGKKNLLEFLIPNSPNF